MMCTGLTLKSWSLISSGSWCWPLVLLYFPHSLLLSFLDIYFIPHSSPQISNSSSFILPLISKFTDFTKETESLRCYSNFHELPNPICTLFSLCLWLIPIPHLAHWISSSLVYSRTSFYIQHQQILPLCWTFPSICYCYYLFHLTNTFPWPFFPFQAWPCFSLRFYAKTHWNTCQYLLSKTSFLPSCIEHILIGFSLFYHSTTRSPLISMLLNPVINVQSSSHWIH